MKILVINSLYPPYHRGGAEVVVGTLVEALKADHDVSICTLQPGKGFSSLKMNTSTQDGVTIHRFYPLNIFSFITLDRHPFWQRAIWHVIDALNIHSYFAIRNLVKRTKPDVVLTHNVKGIGYTVFRALKGTRVIHTMHDVQMIEPSGLIMWDDNSALAKLTPFKRFSSWCARHIVGSPDRVVFPSRFLKELYEKYGFFKKSQRVVFANPVPDSFFSTSVANKVLHTPCRFFMTGQVATHKGIIPLIEAFKLIPDLDCVLTIVGDGQLLEYVREYAKTDTRVKPLGRVENTKVREILRETDYTIVPSLCYENSPLAIYESLSSGAPVIAADIGGVAELVQDGVNAYVVPPGDAGALAQALKKAAVNPDYAAYSKAGRQTVTESAVSKYIKRLLA